MSEKNLVVGYGRFNPITGKNGHGKVYEKVLQLAAKNNCEGMIWTTSTQDNKKNPLKPEEKMKFLKKAFPKVDVVLTKGTILNELARRSPINKFILVVGGDRIDEFKNLILKYNHGDYDIKQLEVVSVGERGNRAISATQMRKWALEGNKEEFFKNTSENLTNKEKEEMYDLVRERLNTPTPTKKKKTPLKEEMSSLIENVLNLRGIRDIINNNQWMVLKNVHIKSFDQNQRSDTNSILIDFTGALKNFKISKDDVNFMIDSELAVDSIDDLLQYVLFDTIKLFEIVNGMQENQAFTGENLSFRVRDYEYPEKTSDYIMAVELTKRVQFNCGVDVIFNIQLIFTSNDEVLITVFPNSPIPPTLS